ncbi:TIGR02452 family protein [Micromonospora sp. NBC_01655]|uniref:TIGR02452 family protein n=1 Tax=Micromonospora sp. NBC_01655 TaxID=2975983 RepID=UPI0022597EE4|nr:TIGR02452 family protein [Micromonospora sp. NBC_01655]MCX4471421.1 TIGR02452 family protein [Micromonospora sp. NBC_01655]
MSSRLRAIARDTVAIVGRGAYRSADGEVAIGSQVARAVASTRLYLPDDAMAASSPIDAAPAIEVTNESTLEATRRLGGNLACLVFASARNPGGGFLNGAQAQEESLARGSALYPCLRAAGDFYAHHRTHPELTYSDRVIYSPAVPVFRDDKGALLPAPYPVSFLTAAAPNRSAIVRSQPQHLPDLPVVLTRRAMRILQVAATNGHRRLVLGAWGCGVFGNDPVTVASAFATALHHSPWFDTVVFAILDRQPATPTHAAFAGALHHPTPGQPPPTTP